MQNDLNEFFAMVDFTNPGVLGKDGAAFRKRFEGPILRGREPWATDREVQAATTASTDLSAIVNQFILRRTNTLLSKHLPPKLVQVVVIKMSPLQEELYKHFMTSKATLLLLSGRQSGVLSSITALKKLCNHPKLVYQASCVVVSPAVDGLSSARCLLKAYHSFSPLFLVALFCFVFRPLHLQPERRRRLGARV